MPRQPPPAPAKTTAGAKREPIIVIVAGRNGAGKTTLARHLISKHEKPMVIAPSRQWGEWGNVDALAKRAIATGCDVLVLDDADAYLPTMPNEMWNRIFITNRHLGIDVVLLTRQPQRLALWAVSAATHAYLLPLGPRERQWCVSRLGMAPPLTGYNPVVVTL